MHVIPRFLASLSFAVFSWPVPELSLPMTRRVVVKVSLLNFEFGSTPNFSFIPLKAASLMLNSHCGNSALELPRLLLLGQAWNNGGGEGLGADLDVEVFASFGTFSSFASLFLAALPRAVFFDLLHFSLTARASLPGMMPVRSIAI